MTYRSYKDCTTPFLSRKADKAIIDELARIAQAKLLPGDKTATASNSDTEIPDPALAIAGVQRITQTAIDCTSVAGPNNTACSTTLHELYLLEKEKYGAEQNVHIKNPYATVREPKEKYIDPISDDDNIDYDRYFHPWEEQKSETSPLDLIYFPDSAILEEKEIVMKMLNEYESVFSQNLNKTPARVTPMQIKVDESKWRINKNRNPPRIQSHDKNEEIKRQVLKMLEEGLIEPSIAAECSQVVLALKPDGKWRFCIDYRNMNDASEAIGWPIPNIEQMLHRIGHNKPKYFAVMDLTSGFFQAPLHPDSAKYTAFTTFMGNYQWLRVPMGAKGSPSWFQQQLATKVLAGLIYTICELYIDDIIIYANTLEEYIQRVSMVLQRLKEFGITINPKKCKFLMSEVEYVGYIISKEGLEFSKEKKEHTLSFELPKTYKALKQFVGLAEHFHRHVKDFVTFAYPSHQILKGYTQRRNKHQPITWSDSGKKCVF